MVWCPHFYVSRYGNPSWFLVCNMVNSLVQACQLNCKGSFIQFVQLAADSHESSEKRCSNQCRRQPVSFLLEASLDLSTIRLLKEESLIDPEKGAQSVQITQGDLYTTPVVPGITKTPVLITISPACSIVPENNSKSHSPLYGGCMCHWDASPCSKSLVVLPKQSSAGLIESDGSLLLARQKELMVTLPLWFECPEASLCDMMTGE